MSCGKKRSIYRAERCNPTAYFQTIAEKRKMYAVEIVSTRVGIYTERGWLCSCDGERSRPAHMMDKTARRELTSSGLKTEKEKLSLGSLDVCEKETSAFEVEFRTKTWRPLPSRTHVQIHNMSRKYKASFWALLQGLCLPLWLEISRGFAGSPCFIPEAMLSSQWDTQTCTSKGYQRNSMGNHTDSPTTSPHPT